jgi:hypothetical protein
MCRSDRSHSLRRMDTQHPPRRRSAMALITGATFTIGGCLYMALAQSTSHVPGYLYRSPLSRHTFVFFAFYAAAIHLGSSPE